MLFGEPQSLPPRNLARIAEDRRFPASVRSCHLPRCNPSTTEAPIPDAVYRACGYCLSDNVGEPCLASLLAGQARLAFPYLETSRRLTLGLVQKDWAIHKARKSHYPWTKDGGQVSTSLDQAFDDVTLRLAIQGFIKKDIETYAGSSEAS